VILRIIRGEIWDPTITPFPRPFLAKSHPCIFILLLS